MFADSKTGQLARRQLDLKFIELVEKVRQSRPGEDLDLLRRAYDFAAEHHAEQTRLSGEPYLSHPLSVAHVLADMRLDVATLVAALLHDTVEDTGTTLEEIRELFGAEVARLVEGATKPPRGENLGNMRRGRVNDGRGVLFNRAERLHNMRTIPYRPPERQQRI